MSSSAADEQLYLRCKRQTQTYFVIAKKTDTVFHVKERISAALTGDVSPRKMRLYLTEKSSEPLPDSATMADHDVSNDACLYVVFRKPGQEDDEDDGTCWEDVDVIKPDLGD
uniref:Ubiquitin-like domain-containing protein n=1 Tax=Pseudictyota dubia TaxID=2749911 RepID=A0A7R9Z3N5_9STRA|mmetsp:Transcript_20925/g.39222  ORF Transcript_20925/g.39222 Transcript_20925/m.39222 type:complete len:112 (+) Transcript_20925:108-443(+)|eukprot:CAMPEP_0197459570 /NCGR_PEP_ID=MMETSP1175-20131217/51758_1 /TAXON_ID=1003142 /ORGANISM="Triceratium dubium, Strain CCMP147" /LENGTH=111 /DNA_ID=CAMNT_0042994485 /DNA_START=85 /DNA_END=420 /DNA_ORIENTATION=+